MKNLFSLLLSLLFSASVISAQGQFVQAPIIIQNGINAKTATSLDEAISLAQDGDLIYLPGGDFFLGNAINKRVHIYGVGWRSDSAAVTGATRINPGITLNAGANGGSLNGIYVQGSVKNPGGQNLATYFMSRIFIGGHLEFVNNQSNSLQLNISRSVIEYVNFYSGTLNLTNSIMVERFYCYGQSTLNISYCVLPHFSNNELFANVQTINLNNSIIFQQNYFWYSIGFADFKNNLFVGNSNGLPSSINGFNGNIVKDISVRPTVFKNYPGLQYIDNSHDFHTQPGCADCSNKGIYAGPTPYFDVPENPYITQRSVTISADGKTLNIKATVNKGKN
jgi:hypothetical protein